MVDTLFDVRNAEICRQYVEEKLTLKQCSERFGLSRQRTRQILKKAGVYHTERTEMRSDREEFLGVNVSEEDKAALKIEAARRGISMSALTSDLIKDMLAGRS